MELKIVETVDNSNVTTSVAQTKSQFKDLQKTLEGLDFKNISKAELPKLFDKTRDELNRLKKVVSDYTKQIDELRAKQLELQKSTDKNAASQLSVISTQINDMENLLRARKNEISQLAQYRDKLVEVEGALERNNKKKKESIPLIHSMLGGTENYNKIISKLPAGLRSAVTGIWDMVAAAKAFIATKLGIVVAALVTVFQTLRTYLTSAADGQQHLATITGYLKGVMMALKEEVIIVGRELYNAFSKAKPVLEWVGVRISGLVKGFANMFGVIQSGWEGIFTGNWENFKNALKGVGEGFEQMIKGESADGLEDKLDEYGEKMAALERRRTTLARQRAEWVEKEAELDREIAKAQTLMFSGNEAQKQAAAGRVMSLNNKKYAQLIKFATEEYNIQKDMNAITGKNTSRADLNEEIRLKAEITRLDTQRIQANRRPTRTSAMMANKELQAENTLQNELNSLVQSNIEKRLELMDEGSRKQVAQIEASYSKQMESIRKQRAKWEMENQKAGRGALSEEQLSALSTAESLANQARNKAIQDMQDKSRLEYLKEYGSFREKEQALREEYDKKRKAADELDLIEQKRLRREFEENMKALYKTYSATYALIFSDAGQLSDTLLAKAIKETEKAIEDAKSSGNIQSLTELTSRLRKMLDEQAGRKGLFEGITQGFKDLATARERLKSAMDSDDEAEFTAALEDEQSALALISKSAEKAQSWMSKLSDTLRSFEVGPLSDIADFFDGISDNVGTIVSAFSNVGKEITSSMKTSAISAGIDATLSMINMIGSSISERRRQQEEWNKTIDQAAHSYAMLKLEQLDYQQKNIFGVENPYQKAIDGARQYSAAMGELQGSIEKLQKGQIQTDTKNGLDWSKIGQGFAKGAGAGALIGGVAGGGVFSWATAAIGAAVGGLTGAVAGGFSTKLVPVMESLSSQYDYLFDENYELNPQLIADYEKLDDETKQIVDNWQEIKDKANEAEEQMRQNFADLSGDIGNQLADSLVDAFRNGKLNSAIDDFHDKMTSTIEDIIEQMVFSSTFGAMFDELQERMEKSFGAGGDNDLVDDLVWMEQEYQKSLGDYEKAMGQVKSAMEDMGYSVFSGQSESNTSASRAVTSSVTEATASAIEGRLTSIQISSQIRTDLALRISEYVSSLSDMIRSGGTTLTEIRDMHLLEVSYLADIAKQTKPIMDFRETIEKIERNTSRL